MQYHSAEGSYFDSISFLFLVAVERERQRQREEAERRRRERERRRREEEERRRRERIERERRIQEQISKETDALKNKLGRAAEKRRLNTSLTGTVQQFQRTHVLAQTVEDDAEGIQYEEVFTICGFRNLEVHCVNGYCFCKS